MRSSYFRLVPVTCHSFYPRDTMSISIADRTAAPNVAGTANPPSDIGARLAGLGAIAFAVIVVLQNLIRGSGAPANGASSSEVLAHYADHRTTMFVLLGTYVLSGAGLAVF